MPVKPSAAAVIPARYTSTRFPGKPLALLAGKPMIQHVYERVRQAAAIAQVLVATDDERILRVVKDFGGEAVLTSAEHICGTDRVAEVAASLDADVVVDVQGDEPLIDPRVIDQAVAPFLDDAALQMSTLGHRLEDPGELRNPDVVKVSVGRDGYARDFFRLPEDAGDEGSSVLRHIGLYVFRRHYLLELADLEPTARERALGLEQLRALEHGCRIKVVETRYHCVGVDRPEDLKKAEQLLAAEKEASS